MIYFILALVSLIKLKYKSNQEMSQNYAITNDPNDLLATYQQNTKKI
jgi:hypothetical protein